MRCLLPGETGGALEIGRKTRTSLTKQCADLQCMRGKSLFKQTLVDGLLSQCVGEPIGGLAQVKGDWRRIGGNHAPRAARTVIGLPRRMRRDATPTHCSGEAELV